MNHTTLSQLITAAVRLDRQIAQLEAQLKEMKASIVAEAATRAADHVPTAGGGGSIAFTGADGSVAHIAFPAPTLKGKIDAEGRSFDKIKDLAGKLLPRLFVPAVVYRPVAAFRAEAAALLAPAEARKLVRLCESPTTPRVSFETKKETLAFEPQNQPTAA